MRLKDYLDADWDRLSALSSTVPRRRRMTDAMHPRFAPVVLLRCAQVLQVRGWRRAAKLFSMLNVVLFGMEVPATLDIGPGLIVTHTNGIVLGAGSIGRNATIYQQVTLGALEADFQFDPAKRPIVEDDVTLAAGSKVLGPVRLARGCTVGANAVVLQDVPAGALAVGVPARIVQQSKPYQHAR
jgi:serine O-acetyltransferase